jgi:hypothetical protein
MRLDEINPLAAPRERFTFLRHNHPIRRHPELHGPGYRGGGCRSWSQSSMTEFGLASSSFTPVSCPAGLGASDDG